MASQTEKERRAASVALAAKRGEMNPDELKGKSREMYDNLTEDQLEEMSKSSDMEDQEGR